VYRACLRRCVCPLTYLGLIQACMSECARSVLCAPVCGGYARILCVTPRITGIIDGLHTYSQRITNGTDKVTENNGNHREQSDKQII